MCVVGADSCSSSDSDKIPECAVCLQTCIHPVQLPCTHIFCFLCVKGVANQSKRCALCRTEIPVDFLNNPHLMRREDLLKEYSYEGGFQWFYEGRNGWWQYDERTSNEMEDKYKINSKAFEILIAGFLYVINMERMVQFRRNDPTRCRKIKRDLSTIPRKGVAGLKFNGEADSETSSVRDEADGVGLLDSRDMRATTQSTRVSVTAPGDSTDVNAPRPPNNTPQSTEDGSPGEPSSPTHDDITATMANLSLTTTSRRHLPRHHRHMFPLEAGPPRTTQLANLSNYSRTSRMLLLDTPSSSSDSDWDWP